MLQATIVILRLGFVLAVVPPLFGFAASFIQTLRAFSVMRETGVSDPVVLVNSVGQALTATMAGLMLCLVGEVMVASCGIVLHFLERSSRAYSSSLSR